MGYETLGFRVEYDSTISKKGLSIKSYDVIQQQQIAEAVAAALDSRQGAVLAGSFTPVRFMGIRVDNGGFAAVGCCPPAAPRMPVTMKGEE